ncbi:MAG: rhomboid family intramembrane serine protease, partial [Deltaproteobacteria bacterium]|nr:rhomboid family intramembrane serine protease [Deltaproteobacteria bacterium]
MAGVRVAGAPKATMALAGLALVLSAALWLAPDPHRDQVLGDIRAFGKAHPTEIPPEDCSVPMGMGPWLTQGTKPASADYETLCTDLRQAELRSGSLRLSLGYEHNGPLDWLLHPLVFANPILALLGCALLFLGVGPYLEERWGRPTYLGLIAVAALGSAAVRTLVCNSGSLPWTGAQGWLGALVAAFTVVFLTAQVKFVAPTWPPRMLTLPAWSVAAWWLMVRLVAMWTTGADRASVIGELAGWFIGLGAGLALQLGWLEQVQTVAGPRLGAGLQRMRRLTQKPEAASQRGQPPPPEPEAEVAAEAEEDPPARETFDFEPEAAPADPLPELAMPRRTPRQLAWPAEA